MANILTIAGSDPSGQAGIQADLDAIRSLGHRGFSVITAVTAQNDARVYSVNPVDTKVFRDQLQALLAQYSFDAIKIGLLGTNELAYQVYRVLDEHRFPNVIVDPVLRSSSGAILLESSAISVLTSFLLPLARVVTPNLDEAEALTGMMVRNADQMATAAQRLYQLSKGVGAVLVKGGHLKENKEDVLFDGEEVTAYAIREPYPENARGTGCLLSTAIACQLADGKTIPVAVQEARHFLDDFILNRS